MWRGKINSRLPTCPSHSYSSQTSRLVVNLDTGFFLSILMFLCSKQIPYVFQVCLWFIQNGFLVLWLKWYCLQTMSYFWYCPTPTPSFLSHEFFLLFYENKILLCVLSYSPWNHIISYSHRVPWQALWLELDDIIAIIVLTEM